MTASRAFSPSDDEAVVVLYARLHAHDASVDAPDLARWRAFRALSSFDGAPPFELVWRDDCLVALRTIGRREDPRVGLVWRVRVLVDPSARRAGLATQLLAGCEALAAEHGVGWLEAFVPLATEGGVAFAEARGFEPFCHDLFLTRPATPLDAPVPAGVRLRPFGSADAPAWVAIANATLVRDVGFSPESERSVVSYARLPGFAAWLAEAPGPVGYCHVEVRGATGYVQAVGVLASHEGRGIGAALVARGVETLRAAKVERIELCTERDNERAQRLYARIGFVLDREAITFRKKL